MADSTAECLRRRSLNSRESSLCRSAWLSLPFLGSATRSGSSLNRGQASLFRYLIFNLSPFYEITSHRKELTYSGFQPPFVIPPVQIRTCAANASGSCFESDAQTLPFGAPCLNRSLILPASEFRTQEGKQNSSQPSPFAPQAPLISFALLLSTNDLIVRRFMPGRNTARACLGQRLPMYPPFPVSWQKGVRPCITFPQAPLSSRTVGFPESGWQQQRFPRNPSHPIRSLSTRLHSPLE